MHHFYQNWFTINNNIAGTYGQTHNIRGAHLKFIKLYSLMRGQHNIKWKTKFNSLTVVIIKKFSVIFLLLCVKSFVLLFFFTKKEYKNLHSSLIQLFTEMPLITSHVKVLQTIKAHTSDINCIEFWGNHLLFTGSR